MRMEGSEKGACRECLRRSWLLSELGVVLDYRGRDGARLLELLELDDETLIEAVAGRRRGDVRERWEGFESSETAGGGGNGGSGSSDDGSNSGNGGGGSGVDSICRHRDGWPDRLGGRAGAPRMLYMTGAANRLSALNGDPAVAIVGSRRASDYGMEVARGLGRGLAASGVTVVSGFSEGIGAAAQMGALDADGPAIMVMAGGVDVCRPANKRGLYERVRAKGCVVAELPCGFQERRWCGMARARTIAGLAGLTIVVEAEESGRELAEARVAQGLGRTVGAVPGRVTSPLSRGTCRLLTEGAALVRGADDALELLYGPTGEADHERGPGTDHEPDPAANHPLRPGARRKPGRAGGREQTGKRQARLRPRLRGLLDRVGAGRDTVGKLAVDGGDVEETMVGLSELELMGLLARGDGGRYVVRES
jgi:DNA processing protein